MSPVITYTKKAKILLIYTKSGGGHLAACKTIMDVMERASPGKYEFEILDIFEDAPNFVKTLMDRGYVNLIYRFRWLWNIIYYVYSFRPVAIFFISLYVFFAKHQFVKNVKKIKPDGLIFTYFASSPAQKVLYRKGVKLPCVTVVTDLFTPPNVWFLDKDLHYIVASHEAGMQGLKMGVSKENLKIFEGLIHPKFEKKKSPDEILRIKEKLKLNDGKTILFTGGGLGLKQTVDIVDNLIEKSIENTGLKANLIIVCGRNTRQLKKVQQIMKKNKNTNLNILPFGFVDNMDELVAVCDLGVTKAGPATMMEFFLQGKNIILTDYIWGQEFGNYEFIIKNNYGLYETDPQKITLILEDYCLLQRIGFNKPEIKNEVLQMGEYLVNYFENKTNYSAG